MKTENKENELPCRMITPEFRVSYPHMFKAQAPKAGDKPKYSITMLVPKNSDLTGSTLNGAAIKLPTLIVNAKNVEFGQKENWPKDLESPVIDGDLPKFADKEGYKGHWVIKATSMEDAKPGLVDANMVPITDQSKFYPGCYARAYVFARVWYYPDKNKPMKKGVQFILDHVQKTRDGQSFGGKKPVEQVFQPIGGGAQEEEDVSHDFST